MKNLSSRASAFFASCALLGVLGCAPGEPESEELAAATSQALPDWAPPEPVDVSPWILNPPYGGLDTDYGPDDPLPRWMLGRHLGGTVPQYGTHIVGSDLGIAARYRGTTYLYMGDTTPAQHSLVWISSPSGRVPIYWPHKALSNGACGPEAECQDAIVAIDELDNDPSDGLSLTMVSPANDDGHYRTPIIDGVHKNYPNGFWSVKGEFSTPTGAMTRRDALGHDVEVQLWYATFSNTDAKRSYAGCSTDGKDFENCYCRSGSGCSGIEANRRTFSQDKFIQVSPVQVSAADLAAMALPPSSEAGYLLFGAGEQYRCSPLYLAYVSQSDFGQWDGDGPKGVKYYSDAGGVVNWASKEEDASPIIKNMKCGGAAEHRARVGESKWKDVQTAIFAATYHWLVRSGKLNNLIAPDPARPVATQRRYQAAAAALLRVNHDCGGYHVPTPSENAFGELSVKRVPGTSALVLLSQHGIDDPDVSGIMNALGNNNVYLDQLPLPSNVCTMNETQWKAWLQASSWLPPTWMQVDPAVLNAFKPAEHRWETSRVHSRTARLSQPWAFSESVATKHPGYGPYIIDQFTEVNQGKATVWHTLSTWKGAVIPGVYGTYTAKTVVDLP